MYLGYVETIEAGSARGWVYDKQAPMRRLEVELVVDDWPVARAGVDWDRADLAVLKIGRTDFGFNLRLPPDVLLDVTRVGVRVVGSKENLPLSDQACRVIGMVEESARNLVSGWGWHVGYPNERLTVDIKLDGRLIGSGVAEQFRDDLRDGGVGDGYYGFRIPLSPPLDSAALARIEVIDRRSATPLGKLSAPIAAPAPYPAVEPTAAPTPPQPAPPEAENPRVRVQVEDEPIRISREAAEALRQAMGLTGEDSVF